MRDEDANKTMQLLPLTRPLEARYQRDSAFSYTCNACCRCCHDKIIRLNPYEVARLARNRGIGTTEFLARYTAENGTALRQADQGACVFLGPEGCTVHEDRPLVCRLYPLGRSVTAEGEESFHELQPHPGTEGAYGAQGTVADFLVRQGAGPFIEMVDRFVAVVGRMTAALTQSATEDRQVQQDVEDAIGQFLQGGNKSTPEWIDMDLVVSRFCVAHGRPIPSDVAAKTAIHLQAIDEWVRSLSTTHKEGRV